MPIYNIYKLTFHSETDNKIKLFNSRKEICDFLKISTSILYKIIHKTYDAKYRPHLHSQYISIEIIETKREYLTQKT